MNINRYGFRSRDLLSDIPCENCGRLLKMGYSAVTGIDRANGETLGTFCSLVCYDDKMTRTGHRMNEKITAK